MFRYGRSITSSSCPVFICCAAIVVGLPMASAQGATIYHDDFEDGDYTMGLGTWVRGIQPPGSTVEVINGDLVLQTPAGFMDLHLQRFDGAVIPRNTEWSFRARMTVISGLFGGAGTTEFNHAALVPDGDGSLRVGTSGDNVLTPLAYPYYGEELLIQMDTFDGFVTGTVWKEGDPASVVQLSWPYTPQLTLPNFGVGRAGGSGHVVYDEAWVSTMRLFIDELP